MIPTPVDKTAACAPMHNPWLSHRAMIEAITPEIPDVVTLHLKWADPVIAANYRFSPGQFNMLYIPGCGEAAISLSGSPDQHGGALLHTIRRVGRVTEAICALPVGGQLGVRGPYGAAWNMDACLGKDVVFMSGGIGLAPLRPMIYAVLARRADFGRIILLSGARAPDKLLFPLEHEDWLHQGLEVWRTVDQPDASWKFAKGVVPALLDQVTGLRPGQTAVVSCGPEVMLYYGSLAAAKAGIPKEQVWVVMERNMQCAVGFCGHCQLGPTFICKDGPVFRFDRLEPYLRVPDM